MARATFRWDLPTEREDGAALSVEEIQHTEVSLSADGGNNFSPPAEVDPGVVQEFAVGDLVGGSYIFRGVTVDIDDRRSNPVDVQFNVAVANPLGPQNATVDIS